MQAHEVELGVRDIAVCPRATEKLLSVLPPAIK